MQSSYMASPSSWSKKSSSPAKTIGQACRESTELGSGCSAGLQGSFSPVIDVQIVELLLLGCLEGRDTVHVKSCSSAVAAPPQP